MFASASCLGPSWSLEPEAGRPDPAHSPRAKCRELTLELGLEGPEVGAAKAAGAIYIVNPG
ncbi:hypothetical protein ANO14919_000460 [Xylariales sp. No.14919]|nr:hypothetical protein ANO14919_000460 [Xylariales sp. No.14919]